MTLSDYLAGVAQRRWKIGDLDCSTFMADWLVACGRSDPIADVRGHYATEREMWRLVRGQGGFLSACEARLQAIGLWSTATPRAGDIVAVSAPYAQRQGKIQRRATGAIAVTTSLFAVITSDLGLVIAPPERLPLLKAWSNG